MIGVNDILKKVIFREPLTEEDRFKILRSKRIEPKVVEYLMEKLNDLYIEVLGDYEGSLFELMYAWKLEGWCWIQCRIYRWKNKKINSSLLQYRRLIISMNTNIVDIFIYK